jgi:hypothetical protein
VWGGWRRQVFGPRLEDERREESQAADKKTDANDKADEDAAPQRHVSGH